MKFKSASWESGKQLMEEIKTLVDSPLVEVDADLQIESNDLWVHCHFDDRGFSYIVVKYSDEQLELKLISLKNKYTI